MGGHASEGATGAVSGRVYTFYVSRLRFWSISSFLTGHSPFVARFWCNPWFLSVLSFFFCFFGCPWEEGEVREGGGGRGIVFFFVCVLSFSLALRKLLTVCVGLCFSCRDVIMWVSLGVIPLLRPRAAPHSIRRHCSAGPPPLLPPYVGKWHCIALGLFGVSRSKVQASQHTHTHARTHTQPQDIVRTAGIAAPSPHGGTRLILLCAVDAKSNIWRHSNHRMNNVTTGNIKAIK